MAGKSGGSCKRASDEPLSGPVSKGKSSSTFSDSAHAAVIKGTKRPMRSYNPIEINRNLLKFLGGSVSDIRILPSGDLFVKCTDSSQFNKLIACDNLGESGKPIEVRVEPFQFKSPETKGVISDVPLDLSDDEIKQSLVGQHVCFVKRLPYRSGKDVGPSRSVLVCFNSTILPAVVNIGYLRFRPRPFVPPPRRCFNCCRYGHQAKQCRSAIRCTKCGGRHKYEECLTNNPKCVNCGGMHSAGYGGCPRYREESAINSLMVKKKVNYWTAREMFKGQVQSPDIASYTEFPSLPRVQQPSNHGKTPITNATMLPQSHGTERLNRTSQSTANEPPIRYSISNLNSEQITIPTESFLVFIAEIVKNALRAFSENRSISIESIVANSATANLGIPFMWQEETSLLQSEPRIGEKCPAMDLSSNVENNAS